MTGQPQTHPSSWVDRTGSRLLSIRAGFWAVVAWPVRMCTLGWRRMVADAAGSVPTTVPPMDTLPVRSRQCRAKITSGMRVACTAGRPDASRPDAGAAPVAWHEPDAAVASLDAGVSDAANSDAGLTDVADRRPSHPSVRSAPMASRRMVSPFGQGPGRAPHRGSSRPSNRVAR